MELRPAGHRTGAGGVGGAGLSEPAPARAGRVLLGVTGGISAYKSAEIVRRLRERGLEVRCALTPSARAFVTPLTFEILSGHAVYGEEYLAANGSGEELHVTAAQWADLLLVAPATAHILATLAHGTADGFLGTTALAFVGPQVVAPAMHTAMWGHPAVVENVARLRSRGTRFVGPVEGALASGEVGLGRMADPAEIVRGALAALAPPAWTGVRVLITAGPTFEPIDPVRFLGNRSSGKMGFAIAEAAARRGAQVTLVAGPVSLPTPPGVVRVDVATALEMAEATRRYAPAMDLVVMAAAVADFRPAAPSLQKLKKSAGTPEIRLVRNPDILAELPQVAPRALRVGFAAETHDLADEARRKLAEKHADLLVANDVARSDIGFGSDHNEVTVYRREGEPVLLGRAAKHEIAERLVELFASELSRRMHEAVPAAR